MQLQLELPLDNPNLLDSPKYWQGYVAGREWNVNWTPGGPDRGSKEDYDAYHAGFKVGLALNFKHDPAFKVWWDGAHNKPHAAFKEHGNMFPTTQYMVPGVPRY